MLSLVYIFLLGIAVNFFYGCSKKSWVPNPDKSGKAKKLFHKAQLTL